MSMEEVIKQRRSVRSFTDEQVDDETVRHLLNMGRWAPSAGNRQPWHFYAVRDAEMRAQLAEAAGGQQFVVQAPVVIVVCAEPETSAARYGDRGRSLYCLQDTAAAVQNILLEVHARGLGACWVGAFDEQRCAEVLTLPEGRRPVAMIPIGHPASDPQPRARRSLDEVVTHI